MGLVQTWLQGDDLLQLIVARKQNVVVDQKKPLKNKTQNAFVG